MGIARGLSPGTWIVVLIKDFDTAKQRLAPALGPQRRRALAISNARRALRAARRTGGKVLAVCGSAEAAGLALGLGVEVVLEAAPSGQNPAARAGIEHVSRRGAQAVMLLSSDLPLVTEGALLALAHAADGRSTVGVAARASGRGGTNALFLRPVDAFGLHFGDGSLSSFEADARARGVPFAIRDDPALALDLDEPSDLLALGRR